MKKLAPLLLVGLALTACSTTSKPTASSGTAGTPAAATSSAADTTDSDYILGQAASAHTPYPTCSLAVAGWTGKSGVVDVQVFMTPGPVVLTVTIAGTKPAVQNGTIPAGMTAHEWTFPQVPAASIKSVLLTAPTGATGLGGSCWITGGPAA